MFSVTCTFVVVLICKVYAIYCVDWLKLALSWSELAQAIM